MTLQSSDFDGHSAEAQLVIGVTSSLTLIHSAHTIRGRCGGGDMYSPRAARIPDSSTTVPSGDHSLHTSLGESAVARCYTLYLNTNERFTSVAGSR
jgi:hypothetical protein